MESDVASNVEVTTGTLLASHSGTRSWQGISKNIWSMESILLIFPPPGSKSVKRRNFRKRAKDFMVKNYRL